MARTSSMPRRVLVAAAAIAAALFLANSAMMPVAAAAVEKPTTTSLAEDVASSSSAAAAPSASAASSGWAAPAYCKGNECARFKTLEGGSNSQFEIREYSPATWSTTSFPAGTSWSEVRSKGFDRNFKYIQGAGVAMTAPVLTRLSGDGSTSVSFLVPSQYGSTPPSPKPGSDIKIEQSPVRKVVVRSWVGTDPKLESQKDIDAAFAQLVADADRAGLIVGAPPKEGGLQGWTAGYDSPMTEESKRRHEVWLPLIMRKEEVAPAEKAGGGGLKVPAAVAAASVKP